MPTAHLVNPRSVATRSVLLLSFVATGCPGRTIIASDTGVDTADDQTPADRVDVADAHDAFDAFDANVATDANDVPSDDGSAHDVPLGAPFCTLGTDVAGAVVPSGFCIRRFATVPEARVLLFAP